MIRTGSRITGELGLFAVLLFLARFVMRSHLTPLMDQECHIGGIAVDVLAHGVRFPLLVYAPNEYDNGSFFSGLLTAVSFALLGRNVLSLKLVTHLVSAAGAVAALWLLRACLNELGVTSRRARWAATIALVVAIALAPRIVTTCSMYAVGNHAEGSAIDVILLALFSRIVRTRSAARVAAFWALVGFALYLNKGTLLVIPVLGLAETLLSWRTWARIGAAVAGFVIGVAPEVMVVVERHAAGWGAMRSKPRLQTFPYAFLDDMATLGEHRIELLVVWVASIVAGAVLLRRLGAQRRRSAAPSRVPIAQSLDSVPVTLAVVLAFTCLHFTALTVMAQGGGDSYAIYSYASIVVLFAVAVGWGVSTVEARHGARSATLATVATTALTLFVNRPDAMAWRPDAVVALWRNQDAAACSWRFAEGFEREQRAGLVALDTTPERHAIARCRSLSEQAQILDCIGGIARELNWRRNGSVDGEPPAGLTRTEERAYAYQWGTHRIGQMEPCSEFRDAQLVAECVDAVKLECLVFTDILARLAFARAIPRPQCSVSAPPMDGYWGAMRRDLLARPPGITPQLPPPSGDNDLRACEGVVTACYPVSSSAVTAEPHPEAERSPRPRP